MKVFTVKTCHKKVLRPQRTEARAKTSCTCKMRTLKYSSLSPAEPRAAAAEHLGELRLQCHAARQRRMHQHAGGKHANGLCLRSKADHHRSGSWDARCSCSLLPASGTLAACCMHARCARVLQTEHRMSTICTMATSQKTHACAHRCSQRRCNVRPCSRARHGHMGLLRTELYVECNYLAPLAKAGQLAEGSGRGWPDECLSGCIARTKMLVDTWFGRLLSSRVRAGLEQGKRPLRAMLRSRHPCTAKSRHRP